MQFISDSIQQAVEEVFSTMLSMDAKVLETHEGANVPSAESIGVGGSVGMAGKINGTVYMSYSDKLACKLVEDMSGEAPSGVDQPLVTDVIGELANMVAGGMKRRTSEKGYNGRLVPPIVMVGRGIRVDPNDAPIAVFRSFSLPNTDERLTVRFFAKLEV
jgi:CheY-specific phosphatase CheX